MLHRRKNLSHKQRREQMMLKRAVKRGDISPPPALRPDRRVRNPRNPAVALPEHARHARRLQSEFIKLPAPFLKKTEILASAIPLARPVPPEAAILPDVNAESPSSAEEDTGTPEAPAEGTRTPAVQLTCPKRPKWRYDQSKNEIEANEEGLFAKWLAQTDTALGAWCTTEDPPAPDPTSADQDPPPANAEPEQMPHAPTSFERNIEVYRQLWRVTEISQILLILLDARCPTLHFPPALSTYLSSVSNATRLRTVLVLTKVDIVGPERAAAWERDLQRRFPGVRVVQVESYIEKHHPDTHGGMTAGSRRAHKPYLPSAFRAALVDALRATHSELIEPPEEVKAKPERLANWKPRVKTQVNWDAVLQAHGGQVGTTVGGAAAPKPDKTAAEDHADGEHTDEDTEPEFLTIGVIGQPNVGKSSLLNALFGATKVKASSTPGKTKHFQTLFWTPEVRLVDCPGLIFPNYVHMETQVLAGILPIARVSAIPLCIHHAAQLLPLEAALGLTHPSVDEPPAEYKRTWRAGMHTHAEEKARLRAQTWTANDILTAYATKKGWVTARVGRPDVKRAGNAILRALAGGAIRWAFWPPGTDEATIRANEPVPGAGIWVDQGQHDIDIDDVHPHERGSSEDEDDDDHSGSSEEDDSGEEGISEEDEDEGDEDGAEGDDAAESGAGRGTGGKPVLAGTAGRFGALVLDDEDQDEDADSDASTGDRRA
ncbi:Guanine nucleotide-binding protein-like 1 [Trametes pubescens]|uniref:Guanine nucleotide-binding protein-like 1 n=1 Tax=Trametes pubescens TaxID=154538 RepID=A0A1M2V545_TRAPU|nr:Guanine nucleotide-binding protein-like 1 [Trametes pubescens]